ncbi:MAG: LacI family DNA-binding transcriptional regulator [Verrucomicrobiota bacterium]
MAKKSASPARKAAAPAANAATMAEIARLCGTTKMTVSRVFAGRPGVGEELRQKILKAGQRLNYEVNQQARNFSANRAGFVGIATPFEGLLGSCYFQRVVEGLNHGLRSSPHDLALFDMLSASFEDGAKLERLWRQRKVDGLVILAPHTTDHFMRPLIDSGVPLVVVGEHPDDAAIASIMGNDRMGIGLAVDHLVALGHRRIAFVGGPTDLSSAARRLESFTGTMKSHGLKVDPEMLGKGDYTMHSGRVAGARLLNRAIRPTAIVAANDYMAMGIIQSAQELGLRVPNDLSVTGFDNLPSSVDYWPPLTTVHQPVFDIGLKAAQLLITQMDGSPAPDQPDPLTERQIVTEVSLLVRLSTARAADTTGRTSR